MPRKRNKKIWQGIKDKSSQGICGEFIFVNASKNHHVRKILLSSINEQIPNSS